MSGFESANAKWFADADIVNSAELFVSLSLLISIRVDSEMQFSISFPNDFLSAAESQLTVLQWTGHYITSTNTNGEWGQWCRHWNIEANLAGYRSFYNRPSHPILFKFNRVPNKSVPLTSFPVRVTHPISNTWFQLRLSTENQFNWWKTKVSLAIEHEFANYVNRVCMFVNFPNDQFTSELWTWMSTSWKRSRAESRSTNSEIDSQHSNEIAVDMDGYRERERAYLKDGLNRSSLSWIINYGDTTNFLTSNDQYRHAKIKKNTMKKWQQSVIFRPKKKGLNYLTLFGHCRWGTITLPVSCTLSKPFANPPQALGQWRTFSQLDAIFIVLSVV